MFTGLVQAMGTVAEASSGSPRRLTISAPTWTHRPQPGESISISGVCLTVAGPVQNALIPFDVVPETLAKTTLGQLQPGSRVNLERSLAAGDLMGGHTVQGHIDGTATIDRLQPAPDYRLWIRPDPHLMEFIIPKGSIAVDGVSLTIAAADPASGLFEIALIPTTLELTTLGQSKPGDRVNLETDILARTIVHYLRHFTPPRR